MQMEIQDLENRVQVPHALPMHFGKYCIVQAVKKINDDCCQNKLYDVSPFVGPLTCLFLIKWKQKWYWYEFDL